MRPKKYRHLSGIKDCQCKRCLDTEDELLERWGRCHYCADGYVLPRGNLPLRCAKCDRNSMLTIRQIEDANKALELMQTCQLSNKFAERGNDNHVRTYLKMFLEMEAFLSPFNLYRFRLAGFLQSAVLTRLGPSKGLGHPLPKEALYAKGKAIEKYCPYSKTNRSYLLLFAHVEKYAAYNIDKTAHQCTRSTEAFKQVYDVMAGCYGPEHQMSKNLQEEYQAVKFLSEQLRMSEVDEIFKRLDDLDL